MSQSLHDLAVKLFASDSEVTPKIEDCGLRIRGIFNGNVIFDTTKAKLVWEHKYFPQYWVPHNSFTEPAKQSSSDLKELSHCDGVRLSHLTITHTGTDTTKEVPFLLVERGPLDGYVKFNFKDLDEWLEEQSRVIYHPRDPYHRVDVLPTGRRVKIEVDGIELADTKTEGGVMSLWETSLPGRWYLPRTAVNFEYLVPSNTHTGCPYKGEASYYHITLPGGKKIEDAVWWYPFPLAESAKIEGMLCFYPEKVTYYLDGQIVP